MCRQVCHHSVFDFRPSDLLSDDSANNIPKMEDGGHSDPSEVLILSVNVVM